MKSSSLIIQMKASEQYFPGLLFIMLYEVVRTFECDGVTFQMKATEYYYFPVVLL